MPEIDENTLGAMFLMGIIALGFLGVASYARRHGQGPIDLFHEVTHLVEYVGGPLDGQMGNPWDQSQYIFRRSCEPDRAARHVGAVYKRVEGTKYPVKYKFDGYSHKHMIQDCQEV